MRQIAYGKPFHSPRQRRGIAWGNDFLVFLASACIGMARFACHPNAGGGEKHEYKKTYGMGTTAMPWAMELVTDSDLLFVI